MVAVAVLVDGGHEGMGMSWGRCGSEARGLLFRSRCSAWLSLWSLLAPAYVQALLLRRMALYFDTDAEFWLPEGTSWRDMAPHEWDEWFQPGIRWLLGCCCCFGRDRAWAVAALVHACAAPAQPRCQPWWRLGLADGGSRPPALAACSAERQERGGTARHRQYVLQPVDGRALYMRRGAGVQPKGGLQDGVWVLLACSRCLLRLVCRWLSPAKRLDLPVTYLPHPLARRGGARAGDGLSAGCGGGAPFT